MGIKEEILILYFFLQSISWKKKLTVHLTTHKPKKKKQYLCDFCNKDCKCRQSKWRHMKTCKQSRDKDPLLIAQTMVIKKE